ncbi:MAG: homoserine dehydrogenase [Ruminococcaceae bacterium]|nr:homoserine dehydrogenase [Oscillospiraceae bacterium]
MTKIAIIGFGVVGSGVYEVIRTNATQITRTCNSPIDIKYILDIRDFSNHPESHLFVNDVNTIANDDEVSIVVETMGGLEPANTFSRLMLSKGKTVITSNKELVATYGDELFALACENGCAYYYEASVGGGIPIIRPLRTCLAANRIDAVYGILNGTTNYILTRMFQANVSFEAALKEAQEKGYAEKDPTADVDGFDTGKKICILSSMINGKKINHEDVHTEGIRSITLADTEFASAFGYSIKLIGSCKRAGEKFEVVVAPMLVSKDSQLSGIDDVFNGVMVSGNMLGDALFYGRGAGKLPTASAVVADVIDAAKNAGRPYFAPWSKADENVLVDYDNIKASMYVCVKANSKEDLEAYVSANFSDSTKVIFSGDYAAFITDCAPIKEIKQKLAGIPASVCNTLMVL